MSVDRVRTFLAQVGPLLEGMTIARSQLAVMTVMWASASEAVVLHLERELRMVEGRRADGRAALPRTAGAPSPLLWLPSSIPSGTSIAPVLRREDRMAKRNTSKRERLNTRTGSHFVKRNAKGQFKEMDNVGRSLAADRRTKAQRAVKSGHGDQGDRKR